MRESRIKNAVVHSTTPKYNHYMPKGGFLYILASGRNGTLYIGVISNLPRRLYEHQNGLIKGFAWRHGVGKLVYYEEYSTI